MTELELGGVTPAVNVPQRAWDPASSSKHTTVERTAPTTGFAFASSSVGLARRHAVEPPRALGAEPAPSSAEAADGDEEDIFDYFMEQKNKSFHKFAFLLWGSEDSG
jgi:hypothetical protein